LQSVTLPEMKRRYVDRMTMMTARKKSSIACTGSLMVAAM
jgi:hypothetical protein